MGAEISGTEYIVSAILKQGLSGKRLTFEAVLEELPDMKLELTVPYDDRLTFYQVQKMIGNLEVKRDEADDEDVLVFKNEKPVTQLENANEIETESG